MKVFVDCVGCEQRQMDAERIRRICAARGIPTAKSLGEAHVACIITCGVTNAYADESLRHIASCRENAPHLKRLLVGGCLPWIRSDDVGLHRPDVLFRPGSLDGLSLEPLFRQDRSIGHSAFCGRTLEDRSTTAACTTPRERYDSAKRGYKIQTNTGCLSACAFCSIRWATGKLQSSSPETILAAYDDAVIAAEPSIMLMGTDVGAYGRDIGKTFSWLAERMFTLHSYENLFVHDLNARWLINDAANIQDALTRTGGSFACVMAPVQSGSDNMLRAMNRRYCAGEALDALNDFHSRWPMTKLGTHIIVGFAGETEADFEATCRWISDSPICFLSCFVYDPGPAGSTQFGSAALPFKVRLSRAEELRSRFPDRVKIYVPNPY